MIEWVMLSNAYLLLRDNNCFVLIFVLIYMSDIVCWRWSSRIFHQVKDLNDSGDNKQYQRLFKRTRLLLFALLFKTIDDQRWTNLSYQPNLIPSHVFVKCHSNMIICHLNFAPCSIFLFLSEQIRSFDKTKIVVIFVEGQTFNVTAFLNNQKWRKLSPFFFAANTKFYSFPMTFIQRCHSDYIKKL